MNKTELENFENEIAEIYKTGAIKGPIHLRDGNFDQLINIFNDYFNPGDVIYSSWASHLHALLAGVPREKVKNAILQGKSITLAFPEYNFYSSAIVGGSLPIAIGHAWALKKQHNSPNKVFCFIGDMTFHTGIAHECIKYAITHNLPLVFVIEDNNKSVGTITDEVWDEGIKFDLIELYKKHSANTNVVILHYKFESTWPHSGVGTFVSF
jgi:pyruvate dehydrogenase E1 component alpha subunit